MTQTPRVPRPATGRGAPDRPNPLSDPRAPTFLRRTPRSEPPRAPRRSEPVRERRDRGRGYGEAGYGEGGYAAEGGDEDDYGDEPYRDAASRDRRGPASSRRYGDDPRARRGPYEAGPRAEGRPPSRGRPRDYDERGYDARGYDDRGAAQGYADPYGPYDDWQRRAPAPPAHGRYREQWEEWRDTAAQWLSASLPVPGQRGRRFPVVLLLALVLLAGVVAAGVLLGPKVLSHLNGASTGFTEPPGTYTPGPTPSAQAGFKRFVNAGSNYSIDYPQGWTVSSEPQTVQGQPDAIDLFSPGTVGTFNSMVVEQPAAANSTADPTVIADEVDAAQQGGVTFTPTSSIAIQVNIGGEYWQRMDYTVVNNGQTTHEAICAGHHEGRAYVIVLASGADTFAGDYASYFQPALKSFRFNS